jgi:hypothetical protein
VLVEPVEQKECLVSQMLWTLTDTYKQKVSKSIADKKIPSRNSNPTGSFVSHQSKGGCKFLSRTYKLQRHLQESSVSRTPT